MSGAGSSFSVATTIFVSLAICAIISYGIFFYFKQRISVIEQSQMEQARIMQSFIARSIMQQHGGMQRAPEQPPVQKEITVTESGLIEVSSESDRSDDSSSSETESDSDSEYESESESEAEIKCVQIHDHDQLLHDQLHDQIEVVSDAGTICISINANADKKIISLNKGVLGQADNEESESSDSDNDNSDDSSNQDPQEEQEDLLELKIGYKHSKNNDTEKNAKKATQSQSVQLNYGNMSVSALRQLAKERSVGGEEGDLQKLKKKELIQLLQ